MHAPCRRLVGSADRAGSLAYVAQRPLSASAAAQRLSTSKLQHRQHRGPHRRGPRRRVCRGGAPQMPSWIARVSGPAGPAHVCGRGAPADSNQDQRRWPCATDIESTSSCVTVQLCSRSRRLLKHHYWQARQAQNQPAALAASPKVSGSAIMLAGAVAAASYLRRTCNCMHTGRQQACRL